jgi:hypothetical protein
MVSANPLWPAPPIHGEFKMLGIPISERTLCWGYDRITGALANLGHNVSDKKIGNVLRRHGIAPAPKRSQTTDVEAIHCVPYGRSGGDRLLHYVVFVIQLEE